MMLLHILLSSLLYVACSAQGLPPRIQFVSGPAGAVSVDNYYKPSVTNLVPIRGSFNPSPRLSGCERLGEGRHPVYGNCSEYLQCTRSGGRGGGYMRQILQCPTGQWFRLDKRICDRPQSQQCPFGTLVAMSLITTTNVTVCTAEGEFSLPGCRGFYSCRTPERRGQFNQYTYICTGQNLWSQSAGQCMPRQTVNCPSREEGTECLRVCVEGERRTCRYRFVVEEYASMSTHCRNCSSVPDDCNLPGCIPAGGVSKPLVTINRMLPGPPIFACKGDSLDITLENKLPTGGVTIHWHGFKQTATPHMDGVPFVTQCPVLPGTSFRYRMTADVSGTLIYHSHAGHQDSDGLYGPMIIREPRSAEGSMATRYDLDDPKHYMIIWHWFSRPADTESVDTRLQSLRREGFAFTINGKGAINVTSNQGNRVLPPIQAYDVQSGKRYRFRAIFNTAIHCPIQLSIEGHMLDILATDGRPINQLQSPMESVILDAGERVDFVPLPLVSSNQTIRTQGRSFYIYVRGLRDCDDSKRAVFQYALLRYDNTMGMPQSTASYTNSIRGGLTFNLNTDIVHNGTGNRLQAIPLVWSSAIENDRAIAGQPKHTFYVEPRFNLFPDFENIQIVYPQVNNISWKFLPFPPLTQRDQLTASSFCSAGQLSHCKNGLCECAQLLQVNKDALVEIVFVDPVGTGIGHPFHLHGFTFRVVAQYQNSERAITTAEVKQNNTQGLIRKRWDGPLKDTVTIPGRGYTIIRFVADNPGYWFLHCHVGEHSSKGMAILVRVGEHRDMKSPPANFPKCGNFD